MIYYIWYKVYTYIIYIYIYMFYLFIYIWYMIYLYIYMWYMIYLYIYEIYIYMYLCISMLFIYHSIYSAVVVDYTMRPFDRCFLWQIALHSFPAPFSSWGKHWQTWRWRKKRCIASCACSFPPTLAPWRGSEAATDVSGGRAIRCAFGPGTRRVIVFSYLWVAI